MESFILKNREEHFKICYSSKGVLPQTYSAYTYPPTYSAYTSLPQLVRFILTPPATSLPNALGLYLTPKPIEAISWLSFRHLWNRMRPK